MKRARELLKDTAEYCGALVVVLLALPLLALTAFVLRGVLALAAVAALGCGAVLYCAHPGFRGWFHDLAGVDRDPGVSVGQDGPRAN